jgi:haloacid dehalogenase-like hydrolase
MAAEELLASWNDTASAAAIVDYVRRVTTDGPEYVPPVERIATFDNDGTLWCEKPVPIQLGFILKRLVELATADPSLQDRQPWKAAVEQDMAWLGGVVEKHYEGDDTDFKVLMAGVLSSVAGLSVEEYGEAAAEFVDGTAHPLNGRLFRDCAYLPMVELLRYLEANEFVPFIASAGDRDFMRPFAEDLYGVPAERVIGSSNALSYDGDADRLAYLAEPDVFDDGPVKPVRIWSRVGRRPVFAGGNANGDIPMLRFAGGEHPALRLLVLHDDPEREFDYTKGADLALQSAAEDDWTVVSIKSDWSAVYRDA